MKSEGGIGVSEGIDRPFPKGLFVIDLHKLSEVTGDLSPFLFVEMGTTGLFTVNPREFGDLFEKTLLYTPTEEVTEIVLDPFNGVRRHCTGLSPLTEVIGQFRNRLGGEVLKGLGLEMVLHSLEKEGTVFDRQSFIIFEPVDVGIDPYGDLGSFR